MSGSWEYLTICGMALQSGLALDFSLNAQVGEGAGGTVDAP